MKSAADRIRAQVKPGERFAVLDLKGISSLEALADFSGLEQLTLLGKVKDLSPLSGHAALEELNVADLKIRAGAEAVGTLNALRVLDVYESPFDPEILAPLDRLEQVRGCPYPPPSRAKARPIVLAPLRAGAPLGFDGRLLAANVPGGIADIDVSDDGALLAVACEKPGGPAVRVFRTRDAEPFAEVGGAGIDGYARGVAFGPGASTVLFVAERGGTPRLYRAAIPGGRADELRPVDGMPRLIRDRGARHLALLAQEGVEVLDAGGKTHSRVRCPSRGYVHYVGAAFAGHAPWLYIYGKHERLVTAWDYAADRDVRSWPAPGATGGVAASPDGRVLAIFNHGVVGLFVYDTDGDRRLLAAPGEAVGGPFDENGRVDPLAISCDGSLLVQPSFRFFGYRLPAGAPRFEGPVNPSPRGSRVVAARSAWDAPLVAFGISAPRLGDHLAVWLPLRPEGGPAPARTA